MSLSESFPFESKYVDVNGSKMHYIDEGEGDVVVFVHGIPTSSYLWRNVIPHVSPSARCIAPDLIGCGLSDNPDIEYTIHDHIRYFTGFIDALNLTNVTFVLHGWGSLVGFHYAMNHADNIKALAFFESHIRPTEDEMMVSLPLSELSANFVNEEKGFEKIVNSNYFFEKIFQSGCLRKLSTTELETYAKPFSTPESRQVLLQYLKEVPTGRKNNEVTDLIREYSQLLEKSLMPKLMFYAVPGFLTTMDTVLWAKEHLTNLKTVDLGDALHYAQETKPEVIGEELAQWLRQL